MIKKIDQINGLTINYTYYNNYDLLRKVVKHYEHLKDVPNVSITIIDDGSQIEPLTRDMIPSWWRAFRIEKDYGWGNEMCKNILMRLSRTNWNALMDLDYVICTDEEETRHALLHNFFKYYGTITELPVTFQFAKGRRVRYDDFTIPEDSLTDGGFIGINSFIVSKPFFLSTIGYDTTFGWTYGYDFTFWRYVKCETLIPDTKIKKLAAQAATSFSRPVPGDRSAFSDFNKKEAEFMKTGFYDQQKGWINQRERLKYVVPYPEYIEL